MLLLCGGDYGDERGVWEVDVDLKLDRASSIVLREHGKESGSLSDCSRCILALSTCVQSTAVKKIVG